jgi:branched-chain amino acid transport system ATP-binding protein
MAAPPVIPVASTPLRTHAPLLRVAGLSAYYGELRAVFDVSLAVDQGAILAIIGANGAGKSTLLKAIMGMMNRGAAAHIRGEVSLRGQRVDRLPTEAIVDAGVAMVPEGRRLFPRMTVEDNLLAGAWLPRCRPTMRSTLEQIYELFPRLAERRNQIVSQMSGGEQQMVAIGRALMSSPRLLLFDELSLGLAPAMVDEIYRNLARIIASGVTVMLVEQDLRRALAACNRFAVMLEGSIVLEGRPGEVSEDAITAAYFGAGTEAAHGQH